MFSSTSSQILFLRKAAVCSVFFLENDSPPFLFEELKQRLPRSIVDRGAREASGSSSSASLV